MAGIFQKTGRSLWEVPFRVYKDMKKRNYIFTNKKNSERAIMATILGIISCASLGIVVYLTYINNGQAPAGYGVTGLLATIFSLTGLGLGIVTVREKNYYRLFPVLGILLNLAALAFISLILYMGSMW